jgi:hypothetical protein
MILVTIHMSKSLSLLNLGKQYSYFICNAYTKHMVVVAAMAVMLGGAAALSKEGAFAGKKKH